MLQQLVDGEAVGLAGRGKGEPLTGSSWQCGGCGGGMLRYAGYYERRVLLRAGSVVLRIPRLRCRCGRWVSCPIPWLGKRRRLGADVVARILELAGMRVSLRDTAASVGREACSSLSPQTAARVLYRLPADRPAVPLPRVVSLDGVFVREGGRSRVLLIAQDEERGTILDWEYVGSENGAGYGRLIRRLWRRGVRRETGLERVLGDGAGGLWSVVDEHWPWVEKRNCWWHQLVLDRQAGRALTPRPAGEGRMSTTRSERWNREFRRRYRQMEAFRGRASVHPTMRILAERTLARRTGSDWLLPLVTTWLRPNPETKPLLAPCS